MKILKVYDKINRNTVLIDYTSNNINIKEYIEDGYCYFIINTNIFKTKKNNIAYFSYRKVIHNTIREELDLTHKYLEYKKRNNEGLLIYSKRMHIKDHKSFLEMFRFYDERNEFLEIENHKGKKTINFKIKNDTLNNFLNLI